MAKSPNLAEWAKRYVELFNFALVPIEPGQKAPKGNAWNQPGGYFIDAEQATTFWRSHPKHNMGVVLGPSQLCSLDVDDVHWTRQILLDQLGLNLDEIASGFPCVIGNPARMRILFRTSEEMSLSRHALAWPSESDPDGSKFKSAMAMAKEAKASGDKAAETAAKTLADKYRAFTVFELRAGLVQDVLPPSIHPGTGQPYVWRTPPPAEGFPLLLPELLSAWQNWELFKRDADASCPWKPKAKPFVRKSKLEGTSQNPSVIDAFNRAYDVETMLADHGYTQHGRKWLCPHSSTGLPGITVTEGRVYSHHASDPLANGHQNDAFAVYCLLEHDGDVSRAVKAAAQSLGLAPETTPHRARRQPIADRTEGDDWKALLRRTEEGALRSVLANAYLILRHTPEWRGVLAYNEFADRIDKLRPPPTPDGEKGPWQDVDASKTLVWLQMTWSLHLRSSAIADEAVRMVAWEHRFHPVRDWLDSLPPWDDQPRLEMLLPTVFGTEANPYTAHIGQSIPVSSIARILKPGCKVDEMVVLEGGQGQGKSSCIAELFGFEWYLETSEPPTNKDFYVTMQGNSVVEIGEMQSFSKADINQVKMAITRRDDKYRAPYDRHARSHPRQCIFMGTTNADAYLSDPTGARRFLPVLCRKADVAYIRQWRDQLWAEALHLYCTGFQWWDYPQDLAREEQDSRYVEDPWEEPIIKYLEGHAPQLHYPDGLFGPINEVTVMGLLKHALQMDLARMNKPEQRRVADILRRLGWVKEKQKRVAGTLERIRPYVRPQPEDKAA